MGKSIRQRLDERWRRLTGRLRSLPQFLIVGAQKAGTTSLFEYLIQHPQITAPLRKEVHFFDRTFGRGPTYYRSFFPYRWQVGQRQSRLTGEASPFVFQHPLGAERVSQVIPHAKIIVLLRNPIERAWSQYRHNKRFSREELSFEEALMQEKTRALEDEQEMHHNSVFFPVGLLQYSYLDGGRYGSHLERWLQHFQSSQLLVLESEAFFANAQQGLDQIADFLELEKFPAIAAERHNEGRAMGDMNPQTRAHLQQQFNVENEKLFELLGRRFESWDR